MNKTVIPPDLIIKTGEKRLKTHRILLAAHSKYFYNIFKTRTLEKEGDLYIYDATNDDVEHNLHVLEGILNVINMEQKEIHEPIVNTKYLLRYAFFYKIDFLEKFFVDDYFEIDKNYQENGNDEANSTAYDLSVEDLLYCSKYILALKNDKLTHNLQVILTTVILNRTSYYREEAVRKIFESWLPLMKTPLIFSLILSCDVIKSNKDITNRIFTEEYKMYLLNEYLKIHTGQDYFVFDDDMRESYAKMFDSLDIFRQVNEIDDIWIPTEKAFLLHSNMVTKRYSFIALIDDQIQNLDNDVSGIYAYNIFTDLYHSVELDKVDTNSLYGVNILERLTFINDTFLNDSLLPIDLDIKGKLLNLDVKKDGKLTNREILNNLSRTKNERYISIRKNILNNSPDPGILLSFRNYGIIVKSLKIVLNKNVKMKNRRVVFELDNMTLRVLICDVNTNETGPVISSSSIENGEILIERSNDECLRLNQIFITNVSCAKIKTIHLEHISITGGFFSFV